MLYDGKSPHINSDCELRELYDYIHSGSFENNDILIKYNKIKIIKINRANNSSLYV